MLYYKDMFFIRKKTNHKKAIEAWAVPGGKSATPQNHTQLNFGALNLIKAKPGLRLTCGCVNYNMTTLLVKHVLNGGYSHSHQLNFKLDWSGIKLRLTQVVLTFLWEEDGENECDCRGDVAMAQHLSLVG